MQTTVHVIEIITGIFHQHAILSIGILLLAGYFLGKLCETVKLPAITGYILAGLLLGKSVAGIVSPRMGHNLSDITEIALGFIALSIGGEFSIAKIRRTGID